MNYITPKFGIKTPSPNTPFNQLGEQLRDMGRSIDLALSRFNFNGSDAAGIGSRFALLEQESGYRVGTHYQRVSFSNSARYGTIWQDTNGSKSTYISDGNGKWRRYRGIHRIAPPTNAQAWYKPHIMAYNLTATIDTVLVENETIDLSVINSDSQFLSVSVKEASTQTESYTVRGNRRVNVRTEVQFQLVKFHFSTTASPLTPVKLLWQIVPI